MRSSASSLRGASSAPEALDRRQPTSQRRGREDDPGTGPLARMAEASHEQVVYCRDAASGLRAIIAVHDTTLGPALGGTRMWPYRSELEALTDVLRLSEGMTYKAAVTGLNLGGGKAVILGDPGRDKSEALLRAHGRFVDSLGGRYITAEDVGITVADVETMAMETRFVTGILSTPGGSGDPGPVTAFGVYHGIRACATRVWGEPALEGRRVAVQGAGSVGSHLARHLAEEGARLWVSDLDAARARRVAEATGAVVVDPEAIFDVEADVFAPCALGAVVNDATIPRLRVRVVAGAANNQLAEDRHGDELARRGILYAPDFVINAGGLINVYLELQGYDPEVARSKARGIYDTLLAIFERAEADAIPTHRAAERLAEARIRDVGRAARIWTPRHGARPRRFADL